MATNTYDVGDVVRLSVEFKNQAGAYIDPGGVVVKVRTPGGATSTYTYGVDAAVIKDAVGQYHMDVAANLEGTWYFRWEGLTTNKGASESAFVVADSQFY